MQETQVRSLGWEEPLEQPTPVFLPGESRRQRSLRSLGSQRGGHDRVTNTFWGQNKTPGRQPLGFWFGPPFPGTCPLPTPVSSSCHHSHCFSEDQLKNGRRHPGCRRHVRVFPGDLSGGRQVLLLNAPWWQRDVGRMRSQGSPSGRSSPLGALRTWGLRDTGDANTPSFAGGGGWGRVVQNWVLGNSSFPLR